MTPKPDVVCLSFGVAAAAMQIDSKAWRRVRQRLERPVDSAFKLSLCLVKVASVSYVITRGLTCGMGKKSMGKVPK
jgi:hypothetical protein